MKITELPEEIRINLENYKLSNDLYKIPRKANPEKNDLFKFVEACKNCKEPFLARIDSIASFCGYKCAKTGGFHPCTGIKRPDNVERLKNDHPMKNPEIARKVSEKLKGIKRPYQAGDKSVFKRPEIREQAKIAREKKGWIGGEKHPWWKGGVKAKNLPRYDTYADRLMVADEVRREPQNQNILQVKCKFCNSWYTPKATQVENRIKAVNGKSTGEQNFYCSNECRLSCSIFQQKKYPKDNKPYIARKDQKELRKLVLDRDGYQCQICGEKNQDLICHHINPVSKDPIESADLDNCVTLCKECEKKVHKLPGCNFHELKKCY